MALNNLGLGFLVSAKDAASAVFAAVRDAISATEVAAERVTIKASEMQSELSGAGTKLLAFGTAGAAGLGFAANSAAEFQAAIAEVASITDRAAFPIDRIRAISQEMAMTYGGDLNQQVKAFYQAVSSGASTAADATSLLHAANLLAVGGLSDSFQAVDALTNVVNAYGMSLDQATDIADAMFVAVKVGKTDVTQLAGSIGDLAPMAALAGVGMADMFAAVAAASNQLGSGTKAITGLRQVIDNVLKPTKQAEDEAKKLGIEFNRAALESKGLTQFLKEIVSANGYTKDSLSQLFGSVEALGAVAALTANNMGGLEAANAALADRSGAAAKAFTTLADAAKFAKEQLGANFQVALVNTGDVILPVIEGIMKAINGALIAFNKAPAILRQALVIFIGLASAGAMLVGGLLLLGGAIAGIIAAGKVFLIVFGIALNVFYVVAAAAAVAGLAIAGFRAAIDKNIGGIGTFFTESFGKVRLAYDALTQLFTDGGFSGAVLDAFGEAQNHGVEAFVTQAFLVLNRFLNFFTGLGTGFQTAIAGMGATFKELTDAFSRLGNAFGIVQDGPTKAGEAFDRFGSIGASVGKALAGVFELLVKGITAVINFGSGLVGGFRSMGPVVDIVARSFGNLLEAFSSFGQTAGSIGGNTDSTTSGFERMGVAIGAVAGILGYFLSAIVQTVSVAVSVVGAAFGTIVDVFGSFMGVFHASWDFISAVLSGDWPAAWQAAKNVVFSVVSGIVQLITGMLSVVGAVVDGIGKAFGKDLGIKDAIMGGSKDALKDLGNLMGASSGASAPAEARTVSTTMGRSVGAGLGLAAPAVAGAAGVAATGFSAQEREALLGPAPAPLGALPPTTQTIILKVGEEELTRVVTRQNASDSNRAFGPQPTAT